MRTAHRTSFISLIFFVALGVGCSGSHDRGDGAVDSAADTGSSADSAVADSAAADSAAADSSAADSAVVDSAVVDSAASDASRTCGDATCGAGQICITGRCAGCCDVPPECIPIPTGCSGALGCDCFDTDPCGGCTTCQTVTPGEIVCGNCMCACLAPWTPIDTPAGPRPVIDLQEGDLVFSMDDGEVRAVPIMGVRRRSVSHHAVAHITLASGDTIDVSGSHPTADGQPLDSLGPGDSLGSEEIVSIEMVPYAEPFTMDILPASDTGTYFISGAIMGSTLFGGSACGDCR